MNKTIITPKLASFLLGGLIWLLFPLFTPQAYAQSSGSFKDITFQFATIEEGGDFLGQEDDFTKSFSEFDLASRLGSLEPVTKAEYFESVKSHILTFSEKEQREISTILKNQPEILSALRVTVPGNKVLFIKTSVKEEGGAAYTRRNAIVLPESMLKQKPAGLERLVYHELWHVLSRYNPALKFKLYAILGFESREVVLPDEIAKRTVTNPDAVGYQICYRTKKKADGSKITVAPILLAKSDYDDPTGKKPFFAYLMSFPSLFSLESGEILKPSEIEKYDVPTFGTAYFIHPEEISADHFAFIMTDETRSKNRKITKKVKKALVKYKP